MPKLDVRHTKAAIRRTGVKSLLDFSLEADLHYTTVYCALRGVNVSEQTRDKIQAALFRLLPEYKEAGETKAPASPDASATEADGSSARVAS
jgi:hypothetical protein